MLEKPDIPDTLILTRLRGEFGLEADQLEFLPLGYDVNSAVYRVGSDGRDAFLKLCKGSFNELSVLIPHFLSQQGIKEIIPPLETWDGRPWGTLDPYTMILYPFIEGENAFSIPLSDSQWIELGATVRRIHFLTLPPDLARRLPEETFSPQDREQVQEFQAQVEQTVYADPTAARLAAFMRDQREVISRLIARASQLAQELHDRSLQFVLCHTDLHPGNLLLQASGQMYIVDWDQPVLAPKERDLMFINMGMGREGPREEGLFYQGYSLGYGPVDVDRAALAYYRYARILEDIAAFCQELLLTTAGGEDREQSYRYFTGQFQPGNEIEVAFKTDPDKRSAGRSSA